MALGGGRPQGRLALVAVAVSGWLAGAGGFLARPPNGVVAPSVTDSSAPQFFAPQLTPTQFLFISSPSERKIVYTQLKNFRSPTGRTFVLVDSGLLEPAGLAFDHDRGFLYVADRAASKIYRYRVVVQETKSLGVSSLALVTDGVQLCIMQGHSVEWVAVDQFGDVFYTDPGANTINRIPVDVIERLVEGGFSCGDITVVSEKTQLAAEAALAEEQQALSEAETAAQLPTDAPTTQPMALALYEGNTSAHVNVPGGVVSDGERLYWTNTAGGLQSGSACAGEVHPEPPLASGASSGAPFPTLALASVSSAAYGITKSNTMVFFTTNATGSGSVYAVAEGMKAYPIVSALIEPRGLVWDGDNTVYVADQASSKVFAFPVGRPTSDAPLTQSVALQGAFGLALLSEGDAAFLQRASAAGLREAAAPALRRLAVLLAAVLAVSLRL